MDLKELYSKVDSAYSIKTDDLESKISNIINSLLSNPEFELEDLDLDETRIIANTILAKETQSLQHELEELLKQKDIIERNLEKKSLKLQESKYQIFNRLEEAFKHNKQALLKLHQVKLQSIDLFDLLSEIVESIIITALEKDKDGDITDTLHETLKEITYEAIKEGSLSTIRVRKILSTIVNSAIEIAEATPTRAEEILSATLKGMREGLLKSIDRFKKRIEFMPVEAKHILIEDYDTIIEDLNQTDTLFSQVIITQASQSSQTIKELLLKLNKNMKYDLDELVQLSKETAEVMKERFSILAKKAVVSAEDALKSQKAQEAKRMGIQALGVAKTALQGAIKSAKESIKKD